MSTFFDSTGSPTARTSRTGSPTSFSTMSRSWIIRSKTTSTSSDRGVNTLSRCTSKNIGRFSSPRTARTAGLNRSRCPTCTTRPSSRANPQSRPPRPGSPPAASRSAGRRPPPSAPRARRMMHRRHAHARRIHLHRRPQPGTPQSSRTPVRHTSLRRRPRPVIRIDHRRQRNRKPRLLQLAIHPQMIPPERPRAHHRHPHRAANQFSRHLDPSARRNDELSF
jgi:hypothetical protein